jgi:hypothetical protein
MKELSAAYNRYVDLKVHSKDHRKRLFYIIRLLGFDSITRAMKADGAVCFEETFETGSSTQELREKLPLWKAIREYLRVVPGKSRVCDIEAFLNSLDGKDVTRQAIDSALKRHNDRFEITNKGHASYVELKE